MALSVTTNIDTMQALADVNVNLDVMPKFAALMKESVGADSFYVRLKETLDEFLENQAIHSNVDTTALISNVLTSVTNSATATCMQTALQWVSTEKELLLKKFQVAKDLELADEDKALKEAQAEKILYETIAIQAQTWRTYGKTLTEPEDRFKLLAFDLVDPNVGIEKSRLSYENRNLAEQNELLKSQLVESYAGIHKATAETVTNMGRWVYNYTATGLESATMTVGQGGIDGIVEPLSDSQRTIAKEQAKGYAYNAWANSVSASAGMIGTVLASDQSPSSLTNAITAFNASLNSLRTVKGPYGANP